MTTNTKIQIVNHTQIDFTKWDDCIAKSCNGLVYAYSWFLNIVSPGWKAVIVNDYKLVMPLTHNSKWGISYLYQPFFTQQLGLFGANEVDIQKNLIPVIDLIKKQYNFIDVQLNACNHFTGENLRDNFELNLHLPYEQFFKNYGHGIKDNLRKAKKQNYEVISTHDFQVLIHFFIHEKGGDLNNITPKHYALLSQICTACQQRNSLHCKMIVASDQSIIASAIFIHTSSRIIFINGTSDAEGKKNGALSFLLDQHIAENAEQQMVFDFEGSVDPNLGKFYKSFGCTNRPYPKLKSNTLPWPIRLLKK